MADSTTELSSHPSAQTALILRRDGLRPCLRCSAEFPKAQIKQCSGCGCARFVPLCCIDGGADHTASDAKYCSRDCQRNDWPIHKLACARMAASREQRLLPENIAFRRICAVRTKWMKIWYGAVLWFCVLGMDLPNHPDRLRTHV